MRFDSLARLISLPSVLFGYLCVTEVAMPAEFGDVELSAYALGSWPRNLDIFNQDAMVPASIQEGFGAGLKVGLFPARLRRMVGLEIDSNMHGTALSFPNLANEQNNETGRSDLLMVNTMFNLTFRYPEGGIRPYIGAGIGWSHGMLLNPNIAGRDDNDFASAYALAHQFLGGIQVLLTPKVFLFGEYRYLSATYHWEGLAMDFRTHYGLAGIGLRF